MVYQGLRALINNSNVVYYDIMTDKKIILAQQSNTEPNAQAG